ncbi:MAG TPA: BREX system P-loop protein BrxC [Herpetosiphonaceae bacterium]|nr:BREX system P-loop protein BrxC [Herpetosiphonaceae bacterium]
MTENREIFLTDPLTRSIPNDGVAKVLDPRTPEEWEVLRYELSSFVCDGEYRRGLELILSTYLQNLGKAEQPAVWVSGFYGSGKSHLVRVLEYLWRDVEFPDGVRARSLVSLPSEIEDLLKELTTAGKQRGGLWSVAGTLGAGAGNSVRLALLGILFRGARLPEQYAPAQFVIWLMQNRFFEAVKAGVEQRGKELAKELNNMYVSPVLAQSLIEAYPDFAATPLEARQLLKAQYPNREDISDDELLSTMEDVLALHSTVPGKQPCTLLVFDELQQFIGEDPQRTLQVQTVVEACSSRFGSRLLFVATGQAALQATPQLQKLQGRFTVRVTLSDTDVEQVVREVVLRKKPDRVPALKQVLEGASGEIDRHLQGTRIAPSRADDADLVRDYPLLPVRRRFWEATLRAIDSAGAAGQLRTQLRIVHEAARSVARQPLGNVVAGDMIYDQLKSDMLQSSVLLRDVAAVIEEQDDGTPDGELRSRLCSAIFLIGKLPTQGIAATGIRANASMLADLLVEDLTVGSASLRQRVPDLLQSLVDQGTLMLVVDEYRLQTRESAEWEADYRARYAKIQADDSWIAADRTDALRAAFGELRKGLSFTQGASRTPRRFDFDFGLEQPSTDSDAVPVWVRDEWSVSERAVREDAQAAGVESSVIFVSLPRRDADALKHALAAQGAAKECLDARVMPTTAEGLEARRAMQSRLQIEQQRAAALITMIVNGARIYKGGGNEVTDRPLQTALRAAIEDALLRLFPRFTDGDHPSWGTVVTRAMQGSPDALTAVGYTGNADQHPACREILNFVGGTGKRGTDIRRRFMGAPYGWGQDAVDGALLALVAADFIRAKHNGQALALRQITRTQIGQVDFFREGVTITAAQRIGVKGLLASVGAQVGPGEEAAAIPLMLQRLRDLAGAAGGDPPLPERPSTVVVDELRVLAGNEQFVAVYERRKELQDAYSQWRDAERRIAERLPRWHALEQLLRHARGLPFDQEVAAQMEAIRSEQVLLEDPDPVKPLHDRLAADLRAAFGAAYQQLRDARERALAMLKASEAWNKLPDTDWQQLIGRHGLGPLPELDLSDDRALLAALEQFPLVQADREAADMVGRAVRIQEAAAKMLLPQAVVVRPPQATLHTAADVEQYLAGLRSTIMVHIEAGKPVII